MIVENTITMWVFLLLTMGITQAGLIMWSAVGLEHGVEMAARCASVSDAAIDAGLVPSTDSHALLQHQYERRREQPNNSEGLCGEQLVGRRRSVLRLHPFLRLVRRLRLALQPSQQFVLEKADEFSVLAAPFASVLLCDELVGMAAVLYLCCFTEPHSTYLGRSGCGARRSRPHD